MNCRNGTVLIAVAAFLTASLWAHHSVPAVFDLSKKLALTGTLTKIDWRNPHIEVFLKQRMHLAERKPGMEMASPRWFRDRNVSKSDFEKAIGQIVTAEGLRARDGSLHGLLEKITFQDGHSIVGYIEPC